MILWARKRRQAAARKGLSNAGSAFVERVNAGMIAGLPIAIAIYFWANRLLPVGMDGRADWELHALFAALALALCYPVFRPALRAWVDMLWAAAVLYGLLPVVSALTTERHLGRSLTEGDWVMAGVDLALLATGAALALAAMTVKRTLAGRVRNNEAASVSTRARRASV